MKLRLKILFMCLGCTLTALILQTFLFQMTSSSVIYNRAREESLNSLHNMHYEIYLYLKNIESNLIEIYSEEELMAALKRHWTGGRLKEEFYRKAYDIGTSNFETKDNIVGLYLYTPAHEIISTYRRADTPKHRYPLDIYSDAAYSNADIVKEYIKSDNSRMLISGYYNEYREKNILRFVIKLYNRKNFNEVIGYVVCDADSKAFSSIMEKYSIDTTMFIWLQPLEDAPVVSIGSMNGEEREIYKKVKSRMKEGKESHYSGGTEQELFQVEQEKYNLTAFSLMPKELLRQNQNVLRTNLFFIAVLMVAVAIFVAFGIARGITRPLDQLMATIDKIKKGDTSLRADIGNNDEIGELATNFNEMLDNTQQLMEKKRKADYLLNRAEYKALQAQINPHFLYNTLDTMSSIAQLKNCPEVSRLSQALSNIFRYTLNMKDPFSTVAKEIANLKNYSYVMAVRMQDHVQYLYDIDEQVLQNKIPRISLQPLVENALNHGLRNKRGEKYIEILARTDGNKLVISVKDNGVGMDADSFNKSLEKNDIAYIEQGDSIGLHNINARLKMLHGDEYGLRIESVAGEWTKVSMTMPLEKAGEDNGGEKI